MDLEQKLVVYFTELGLEPKLARLYITLQKAGPLPLSSLARMAGVERTRTYRLLEQLKELYLVEILVQHKRSIYKAAPLNNLRLTFAKQQYRLDAQAKELALLEQLIPVEQSPSSLPQVQFYQGKQGLEQMLWHQTEAKTKVLAILSINLQTTLDTAFYDRWMTKHNQRNTQFYGLINDSFIASQKKWYSPDQKATNLKRWHPRYIASDILPITHDQVVYDDVVMIQNLEKDNFFGIEIRNKQIAKMHRYFFKAYWQLGTPINELA